MDRRTAKVGLTGKYGTRYGAKLRKQAKAIEILQRTKYVCPFCGKNSMKRFAVGIWKCKACRRTVAGGAWEFTTTAAVTAKTTIQRLKRVIDEMRKEDEADKLELKNEETGEKQEKKVKKEKKEKKEKKDTKDNKDKKDKKEKKK
jgi:large subunit ribosomal protein L37Ae